MSQLAFLSCIGDYLRTLPHSTVDAFWIISVGICCSVSCALLGCYLVLRRLSLIGDAISHAVLPGLVLAFLWTGSRNPAPMFIGAMACGVLTAFLTQTVQRMGQVPEDSSMGVVFTSLFALGVVLINFYVSQIDLDPSCVLHGLIEFVGLDTIPFAGLEIPRALLTTGSVLIAVIVFILLFWKELKLSAFDGALATSLGISAGVMHYLLMGMVAVTTVASFESVGSILVVAMLIAPGATAHLLTDRLARMMGLATLSAIISTVAGYFGAAWLNTSVAGMMAVAAGAQFALAAVFAPRHGVLGKVFHNLSVGLRVVREDAMALLWRLQDRAAAGSPGGGAIPRGELVALLGGGWMAHLALWRLVRKQWATELSGRRLALTQAGIAEASRLVRAHRLWETYLTEVVGKSPNAVDESAHRIEHFIPAELTQRLDERLNQPQADPHGSRIPR